MSRLPACRPRIGYLFRPVKAGFWRFFPAIPDIGRILATR